MKGARWQPPASCIPAMVYIGFQLVSTSDVPDEKVAELVPPQTDWSVRDQKAFYVECRIRLQTHRERGRSLLASLVSSHLAVDY